MLDQRPYSILKLIVSKRFVTVRDLEKETRFTRRQLMYDLQKINDWLLDKNFPTIINKRNIGLLVPEEVKNIFQTEINEETKQLPYLTDEERTYILFLYTFLSTDIISLNHLTVFLKVSKNTILEDIKRLNRKLSPFSISLEYSRSNGYHLLGKEDRTRAALFKVISQLFNKQGGKRILLVVLQHCYSDVTASTLEELEKVQEKFKLKFVENKMIEFSYFFTFIKSRIESRITFNSPINQHKNLHQTVEYEAAIILLNAFFENPPKEEYEYIAIHLLGLSLGELEDYTVDRDLLLTMLENMTTTFERFAGVQLFNQKKVIEVLYKHFRPAYYRIVFKIPIVNPLVEQIKKEHFTIFVIVKEILKPLQEMLGHEIPEDEVGYITVYLGALLENNQATYVKKIRAIIICPNGIGVSALLKKELSNLFPEVIFTGLISLNELQKLHVSEYDVIFSTFLIETNKPLIVVNPIMSNLDKANVVRDFYSLSNGTFTLDTDISKMMDTISKFANIHDRKGLEHSLLRLLEKKVVSIEKRDNPVLSEIMGQQMVQLNIDVQDWEEAIRKGGQLLVETKAITENYIEAMIRSAKEAGPYIVVTKHVALPHARPQEGALKLGISLVTLQTPVSFGNKQNDPVKYVFSLSATDNHTHLRAMAELVELLEEKEFYKVLDTAKSSEEIICYIQDYENRSEEI